MFEYLIVLLDDTSSSFCHAENPIRDSSLISYKTLQEAIIYGMKENLMIHFVLPRFPLPKEYIDLLDSIDNIKIGQEIRIVEDVSDLTKGGIVILRISLMKFFEHVSEICDYLQYVKRLNVCFTDIEDFTDNDIPKYINALSTFVDEIVDLRRKGLAPQFNLLTDRIGKTEMVNCGAGVSNITIAPNGKFYLCPAFYYDEYKQEDNMMHQDYLDSTRSVGDLDSGIDIPNMELLRLDHAPLCRVCDAFHCHRCIWLNQKLTGDANTPSHQQCVMAHIERNASRQLEIRFNESFGDKVDIPELNYIDPIEIVTR